jgi:site-specific DNA-methyltransferase (adenine-specific)
MSVYYQDDLVTLYHGDCREITDWLSADVLVTDPPYGRAWKQGRIEGRGNGRRPSDASARHDGIENDHDSTVRDDVLAAWGQRRAIVFGDLMLPAPTGTKLVRVYRKPTSAGVRGAVASCRRDLEAVYLIGPWPSGIGGGTSLIETRTANVATGPAARYGHPHAKPLDVMEELVFMADALMIADPFAGSGSTLVAAKRLGSKAIGVELDERYCEIAARRLDQGVLDFGEVPA